MAYQTYITEAIVCGGSDQNSADRSFYLFTREAGMVFAHAKSVREERSKHRYALQDFSHIRATLVRGRSGWKITGTEILKNFYALAPTREERALIRNTVRLLRRVIQGEVAHEEIFTDTIDVLGAREVSQETRELLFTFRTLHALGYIAPELTDQDLVSTRFTQALENLNQKTDIERYRAMIESGFHESQL